MIVVPNPPAAADDATRLSEFGKFRIDDALRQRLRAVEGFGCDEIEYGYPTTCASGHIDGHRWLFGVMVGQWVFQVFPHGDPDEINWNNYSQLGHLDGWYCAHDMDEARQNGILPHDAVFACLLIGIAEFRAERPFESDVREAIVSGL